MRILLVEDNSDHRELMRLALTGHDSTWEVEAVESGEEALRLLLGSEVFDLVFLDYSLPGRDGLEVLEEIRRGEAPPPVVLVTGRGDEKVAVKAMKGGAYDYVIKGEGYLQRLPVVAQRAVEAHQLAVEHKRVEKALRESEERLRTIVEASLDAIIAVNVEGQLVLFNGAAQELFQYSEEEALNQSVEILLREEICKIHQERLEMFLKRGFGRCGHIGRRMEKLFRRKDGSLFEAEVSMSGGRLDGLRLVVLAIHDITSRKQAEEALRERDIQLKNLASWVPGMLYQFTKRPDGTYCVPFTTEAIKDIFGCSPQDVREDFSPIARIILPEDFDKVVDSIEYSAKHLTIWTCEYRVQIPGKSIRWLLGNSTPEKLADGSITWYGFNTDITERKMMQETLRKSEEQYRSLVESTKDSIYLLDRELRYLFANNAYLERAGLTLQQLIGRSYSELHTFPSDSFPGYVNHVFATGESTEFEYKSFRDNKPFLRTLSPVRGEQGETIAVTVLSKDVTLLKKTENALRKYQVQLRSLMGRIQAAREEERAIIAREIHDELGGALTGLKIDLSYLAATLPKMRDTAKRNSFVNKLKTMTNLIDETIQTVRRIITDIRPSILDDFGLVAAIEWQAQEFQKRTGIECEFISALGDIPFDEQHSTAVFRIFQESLTNVIRHAAATKVTVRLYKEADRLVLKVTDNGKGLIEEKISDPKSMGLLGMRERVLLLGGKLNISGEPWKGTTISVEIPLDSEQLSLK